MLSAEVRSSWSDEDADGISYIVAKESKDLQVTYRYLNSLKVKYLGREQAKYLQFYLMPLKSNHDDNGEFESLAYDLPRPILIFLSAIAYMIAFISCINYVNMAMAQSVKRAGEIGVRKTFGSSQSVIRLQFLLESMFIVVLATIISLGITKVLLMQLNSKFNNESLQLNIFTSDILVFIILFILGVTLLAGFYPAMVLSKISPIKALRNKMNFARRNSVSFRKILVGSVLEHRF